VTVDTQATMERSETAVAIFAVAAVVVIVVVVVVAVVSQTKLLYFYIMALLYSGCSKGDGEK
jgi:hypothetical protein